MDHAYLSKLSTVAYNRLHWYATHPPKPRALDEIPQDNKSIASWRALPRFNSNLKIFPPHSHHTFAAGKFGIAPAKKFTKGVPPSVLEEILTRFPPHSHLDLYKSLYSCSYYNHAWKMRVCEVSVGLISSLSSYSFRTVCRGFSYLRSYWYIRLIWRGRPAPENPRYLHSCYELPINLNHVISWRIHHGRKRKTHSNF